MEALVRCPRCWKRVPQTARFCRRCGCSLHAVAAPPPPEPASPPVAGGGAIAALLSFLFMALLSIVGIALFSVATRPTRFAPPSPPAPTYFENGPDTPATSDDPQPEQYHSWRPRREDRPYYRHSWDAPGVFRYPTRQDRR